MSGAQSSSFNDCDGQAGAVLLFGVLSHDLGSHALIPHCLSLQIIQPGVTALQGWGGVGWGGAGVLIALETEGFECPEGSGAQEDHALWLALLHVSFVITAERVRKKRNTCVFKSTLQWYPCDGVCYDVHEDSCKQAAIVTAVHVTAASKGMKPGSNCAKAGRMC